MNDQTTTDGQRSRTKRPPLRLKLALEYPNCFNWKNPRPLKIGILIDIRTRLQPRLALEFEAQQIPISKLGLKTYTHHWVNTTIKHYCTRPHYLKSMQSGATRIDLDGQPAGIVTEEQSRHAQMMLNKIRPIKPIRKRKASKTESTFRKQRSSQPESASTSVANPLPDDTPLTKEHIVSGRLEPTIKFSQLPEAIQVQSGFKIGIQTEKVLIVTTLPSKAWKKLQQAHNEWPMWVAALTGQYDSPVDTALGPMLILQRPAVQVFEKKPKAVKNTEPQTPDH